MTFWLPPKKKDLRLKKKVARTCPACGKEFKRTKSALRTYCSYDCQDEHMGGPVDVRVARMLDKGGACWEWQGATNASGYGIISVGGQTKLAHRIAYELANGVAPGDMLVCHRCDNPKCCKPEHLYVGTHADNMRDLSVRNRSTTAKTDWLQRVDMVRRVRAGEDEAAVASLYGVDVSYVQRWVLRFARGDVHGYEQLL